MRLYSPVAPVLLWVFGGAFASAAPNAPEPMVACSQCHSSFKLHAAWEPTHSKVVFQHMDNEKHCLLCHGSSAPNLLVLLDGTKVAYSESPKLCGQCHGLKFRDWQEGLHGKFLHKGFEDAHRLACVACHDPHSPKFKSMTAVPAPKHPKFLIEKREKHGLE